MNTLETAIFITKLIDEKKGKDIVLLDISELTDVANMFLIATLDNKRQMKTITELIKKELKTFDIPILGLEGIDDGIWALIDIGDCVIQLFTQETRNYYSLENIWLGAEKIDWEAQVKPNRSNQ